MRIIISLSALLVSVIFVQIGSGSLGPLDALSGLVLNYSSTEIGYLGSSHFLGFLIGCVLAPTIVVRSGHARAFAVFAACTTISVILHPLNQSAWFWMILRVLSGFGVAGAYTVIESWLQSKATSENRGRVFSIYRMVDMVGMLLSQLVIAGLTPAYYASYNLIAAVACMSLVPLALTQTTIPSIPNKPSFKPFFVYTLSPLAAFGILVVGATNSTFRMVAPVYAKQSGLSEKGIALFLSLAIVGGLLGQMPAGYLADKVGRRFTLTLFSLIAIAVCAAMSFSQIENVMGVPFIYFAGFCFGFATLPIYSICATHASDFAKKDDFLQLSASLIFFYGFGAIVAPTLAGSLMDNYGPSAMFTMILFAHLLLFGYTVMRYFVRPESDVQRPYGYLPRTTMFMAHYMKRKRKPKD